MEDKHRQKKINIKNIQKSTSFDGDIVVESDLRP